MNKVLVNVIEYDTEGEIVEIPNELEIELPSDIENDEIEDFLSDEISEMTGWCHNGFEWRYLDK